MAGKGSKPRPFGVDRKTYESNWDKIFSSKPQQQQQTRSPEEEQKVKEQAQDRRNG